MTWVSPTSAATARRYAPPIWTGSPERGLRFSQMYNMARCCPSRAALLTGLNPHQAGVGHMVRDLGYPSYRGSLNESCVTLAEVLRASGYTTLMSGKWHVGGDYNLGSRSGGRRAGDAGGRLAPAAYPTWVRALLRHRRRGRQLLQSGQPDERRPARPTRVRRLLPDGRLQRQRRLDAGAGYDDRGSPSSCT